ncbi:type VI secretion system tube protein Hcp [Variovorax sp. dw_954]|uniref:Hcp family type VI secretion system effector n=1 Tax=unclassified Variovorax TaxID=663243 RepID=UPI001BD5C17C
MKDIYVKFGSPAIKGESQDKDHKDWIEVNTWHHTIVQPRSATASTAGGHTAERCEHGEMIFTKDMDVVSPLLYQHASGGSTFDEVTIEFFRADGEGKRVKYLEIKLKYVLISSVSPSVVETGVPSESFSLKYAAVQWKYIQQKIGGNQGGNSQGAWSLTKNDKTYSV